MSEIDAMRHQAHLTRNVVRLNLKAFRTSRA